MLTTLLLFVCPILSLSSASVENVLILKDASFHEQLDEHPKMLVKFMVSWCHYCEALAPIYEALAEELFYNSSSIRLADLNCHNNNETCHLYDIEIYPTLILFKGGLEFSKYGGDHTREGLIEYLEQEFRRSYNYVDTLEDFEKVKQNGRCLIVGYFTGTSTMRFLFEHYSDELKDKYDFAVIDNATRFGYDEEYLELFRPEYLRNKFEIEPVILRGVKINSKIVKHFINANKHGLVGIRNESNINEFHAPLFVLFYNIDFELNAKKTNYYRNRLIQIALKYPEYNFAISHFDLIEDEIDIDDLNTTRTAILMQVNEKYVMDNEFSTANIEEFLKKYKNGELIPHLRSQPIPDVSSTHVKIVVGSTFNEMVYQNYKDILLAFVYDGCKFCRELSPFLEDLATLLVHDNIDIIKIDVKHNDVPDIFDIDSYPTLVWLSRDDKTDFEYYLQSDKSLQSLLAFIAKRATVELKHYDRSGRIKKINKNSKEEL